MDVQINRHFLTKRLLMDDVSIRMIPVLKLNYGHSTMLAKKNLISAAATIGTNSVHPSINFSFYDRLCLRCVFFLLPGIAPVYCNLFALMRESDHIWFPPSYIFEVHQPASENLHFRIRYIYIVCIPFPLILYRVFILTESFLLPFSV